MGKKITTKFLMTSLLFIIAQNIYSQRVCSSSFNPSLIQVSDNARFQRYEQMEQFILNYKNSLSSPNGKLINPNSLITIPVVVHVLHVGEAIGVGRNISIAQIQSQIDVLNEDFRRLNANSANTPQGFQGVASDVIIRFQLACLDPNGNATNGISRKQTTTVSFSDNDDIKFTATGGEDAWPTSRYLNIWVSTLQGSLLGYAQLPFDYSAKPNSDGVVIRNTAFGRVGSVIAPFHLGRTATHEIGHWLDLFHIWGDDNGDCSGSDQCDDTPNQGSENYGCPGFPHNSCSNGVNGDMFMNYMDYTDDPCMNIFTTNQRIRMRSLFSNGGVRESIINTSFAIVPLTTPICNTGTINLTNVACLTGVTWTINGPATITGNNNSALITRNGSSNGIATVTATAAGYIDTKEVAIGIGTNSINYTQKTITCIAGKPYFYGTVAEVPFAGNNYDWYSKDMTNASNPFILRQSGLGNTADFPLGNNKGNRYYTIRVIVTTPCGALQSINEDGYLFAPSCIGGGSLKITTFPNPTTSNFSVVLIGDNGQITSATNENIIKTELVNKVGTVLQKAKYAQGTKQVSINISTLSPDVYILRIWDGKEWSVVSVVKK